MTNTTSRQTDTLITHKGSCHCNAILFEVAAPAVLKATLCNCSICRMSGFLHLIVEKEHFKLLQGADNLNMYCFNTQTAHHLFCKTCGIKSFYIPRSHPDGYSININCLNPSTIKRVDIEQFDGQHWETAIADWLKPKHHNPVIPSGTPLCT